MGVSIFIFNCKLNCVARILEGVPAAASWPSQASPRGVRPPRGVVVGVERPSPSPGAVGPGLGVVRAQRPLGWVPFVRGFGCSRRAGFLVRALSRVCCGRP